MVLLHVQVGRNHTPDEELCEVPWQCNTLLLGVGMRHDLPLQLTELPTYGLQLAGRDLRRWRLVKESVQVHLLRMGQLTPRSLRHCQLLKRSKRIE